MSSKLTPREAQVLQCSAMGKSAKETGADLGIAVNTVKDFHKMAKVRLGAKSIPHAVAIALARGLIQGVEA